MSTVPIDISYRNPKLPSSFHRDSFAHSQGMGGISWGAASVGSWLREEVMLNNLNTNGSAVAASPEGSQMSSYFPTLEADFCRDYTCCGSTLPTLHDLLKHYEESHITPSPPIEPPVMRRMQNLEMVSTNEVFLSPQITAQSSQPSGIGMPPGQANVAQQLAGNLGSQGQPVGGHNGLGSNVGNGLSNVGGYGMNSQNGFSQLAKDEACIDDPARQLYVSERNDNRPYKCPVIGCEKTYKNQNGLKYHRLHGHQNQTLHQNDDGTYSIIDPLSNTPYPDGMGMEKDKPYRCEICGKRYKNLNGLKYHRAHSTH